MAPEPPVAFVSPLTGPGREISLAGVIAGLVFRAVGLGVAGALAALATTVLFQTTF